MKPIAYEPNKDIEIMPLVESTTIQESEALNIWHKQNRTEEERRKLRIYLINNKHLYETPKEKERPDVI